MWITLAGALLQGMNLGVLLMRGSGPKGGHDEGRRGQATVSTF